MLTLHLVRHAPTLPNAEKRYPRPGEDAPLTKEGELMAAELQLPQHATCFTSPSTRTKQTAAYAGFSQTTTTDDLAEANFGIMAGQTWSELQNTYDLLPIHWLEALRNPTLDFGPPRGETGLKFHARLQKWLETLPNQGDVVAFTHAGPILGILRLTVSLQAAQASPCAVVTLNRAEHDWWLSSMQQVPSQHLKNGNT